MDRRAQTSACLAAWRGLTQMRLLDPRAPRATSCELQATSYKLQDVLLFSNCDHAGCKRRNGAVWLSLDGGDRWPHKRVATSGDFGYSSLAAGRAGTPSEGWVYMFFEAGRATREIKV